MIVAYLAIQPLAFSQTDPLLKFEGVWISVNPPGPHVTFHEVGLGQRGASLPMGQAILTVSNGEDASNLRVSGEGFNCFYFVGFINSEEMVWQLKRGTPLCMPNAQYKKLGGAAGSPGNKTKNREVMDQVGRDITFFEKRYGPPTDIRGSHRDFEIGECQFGVVTAPNKTILWISLRGISSSCDVVPKFMDKRSISEMTLFDFLDDGYNRELVSSCIDICGNAADPTFSLFTEQPRVNGDLKRLIDFLVPGDDELKEARRNRDQIKRFPIKLSNFNKKGPNFSTAGQINLPVKYGKIVSYSEGSVLSDPIQQIWGDQKW